LPVSTVRPQLFALNCSPSTVCLSQLLTHFISAVFGEEFRVTLFPPEPEPGPSAEDLEVFGTFQSWLIRYWATVGTLALRAAGEAARTKEATARPKARGRARQTTSHQLADDARAIRQRGMAGGDAGGGIIEEEEEEEEEEVVLPEPEPEPEPEDPNSIAAVCRRRGELLQGRLVELNEVMAVARQLFQDAARYLLL
jgi:hypothetical protein